MPHGPFLLDTLCVQFSAPIFFKESEGRYIFPNRVQKEWYILVLSKFEYTRKVEKRKKVEL